MAKGEKAAAKESEMALAVLMFTSVAGTEKDPRVRVDDPIGPKFFRWSDGIYRLGKVPAMHPMFRRIAGRSDPGVYGYLVARVRYMDDVVKQEAADGLDQLVILGAGYDTRAYRMREELAGVQVFEVDVPAMSRDKQARLAKAVDPAPDNVSFVEVDFNSQNFLDRLAGHGYDDSARTLFILSGVSMYLRETAVLELFSQVAAHSHPRTSIVFDYCFADVLTAPERYRGAPKWVSRAAKSGEELRYGVETEDLRAVLEEHGLRLVAQHDMPELAERYLRRADGTMLEEPYEFVALAHAAAGAE